MNRTRTIYMAWLVISGLIEAGIVTADEADSSVLSGPYLGQTVPGSTAELFAPGVVSVTGRYEFALSFAPAGDRVLFTVQTADEDVMVLHSRQINGHWTKPESVNLTHGARADEMEAFFSPDGSRQYVVTPTILLPAPRR